MCWETQSCRRFRWKRRFRLEAKHHHREWKNKKWCRQAMNSQEIKRLLFRRRSRMPTCREHMIRKTKLQWRKQDAKFQIKRDLRRDLYLVRKRVLLRTFNLSFLMKPRQIKYRSQTWRLGFNLSSWVKENREQKHYKKQNIKHKLTKIRYKKISEYLIYE